MFYNQLLRSLSTEGILGQIFTKSQNKIQDPAKLLKVIDMIDKRAVELNGCRYQRKDI
jgi:type I restriction enzyme M protein